MNGVIKVRALLDFLSEVYRSKLCSREFPAETLSLRRRVEQFSWSEGRTTGPHHHGYSSNVQFGRPTERAAPPHSYGEGQNTGLDSNTFPSVLLEPGHRSLELQADHSKNKAQSMNTLPRRKHMWCDSRAHNISLLRHI
ncbi:hypothetical protein CRENBAI_017390 [Crenichthys baileyi]|uniref:Uncharacterized protein n=1 Tax=Crenichthys baileyi TaxID=28760 RepID=A0AAV9RX68_9TELE